MTPRSKPIRVLSPQESVKVPAKNQSYAFVFSDDIKDWMGSTIVEKKVETSKKHYRVRYYRAGI